MTGHWVSLSHTHEWAVYSGNPSNNKNITKIWCHLSIISPSSFSFIFRILSSFDLTSPLSVHRQISSTFFFPFFSDSIYSATMSSCLSCGTYFPQHSVFTRVALFRDLNGDHEPIWWFLIWHQGTTIRCVLKQFIERCYTVFGQSP